MLPQAPIRSGSQTRHRQGAFVEAIVGKRDEQGAVSRWCTAAKFSKPVTGEMIAFRWAPFRPTA